jgi:hypothetical protein
VDGKTRDDLKIYSLGKTQKTQQMAEGIQVQNWRSIVRAVVFSALSCLVLFSKFAILDPTERLAQHVRPKDIPWSSSIEGGLILRTNLH